MSDHSQRDGRAIMTLLLVFAVGIAFIAVTNEVAPLARPEKMLETFGTSLLALIAISLLVERAAEVYTGIWRRDGRHSLLKSLQACQAQVAERERLVAEATKPLNDGDPPRALDDLLKNKLTKDRDELFIAQQELSAYRSTTAREVFVLNVVLGTIAASLGIQMLHWLFGPGELGAPMGAEGLNYAGVFRIVDILLTGALIGGGADGLHRILAIFTTAADAKKDASEQRG
ncbi:hypothetical protein RHODOSMS8_03534 [Rhodobiaceae bacterium]|nr:hypothetical protein RHODOSMS8_03534 [Rhodobiaceae bacterium]